MLIEFFGENFGCFRDEFRLSMVAAEIDPDSRRGIVEVALQDDPEPLRLLRAAALYGANASGKSTILRAARSLGRLILGAGRFRSDEPITVYEPFAGDGHEKRPVRLGLKAIVEGAVYDYETVFDGRQVLSERLARYVRDQAVNLFHRNNQEISGEWTSHEQFKLISHDFRPNALLLSLADTLAPGIAKGLAPSLYRLLRFYDGSASRPSSWGQPAARRAATDPAFREWLLEQLKAADIGVTDLIVKRSRRVAREQGYLFEELADDEQIMADADLLHRLAFKHSGPEGPFNIPYESESYGTQKVVNLGPVLYDLFSVKRNLTVFVDEIGASLHPTLLSGLVRHINCETRDSVLGQLIFATHETSLIDDEAKAAILRRDQVYFTEKDASGVARLYSLADFKERQNVNLRKRYLEGRFGAIPALSEFPE